MDIMTAATAAATPTWSYFVPLGGALITGLVAVGPLIVAVRVLRETRRTNQVAEKWRRREETARQLRWAADQASHNEQQRDMAVIVLTHLVTSDLLELEDLEVAKEVLYAIYDRGVVV